MEEMSNSWKMTLPGVSAMLIAEEGEKRRGRVHKSLLERVEMDNSPCLQIGVPSFTEKRFGPNWTSVDLYDKRPCIDHNLDICEWSQLVSVFKPESFRLIMANALFEHLKQPFLAAQNLSRLLSPGGLCYVEVPFVWSFHPYATYRDEDGLLPKEPGTGKHGGDYWRFSSQGIVLLFEEWLDVYDIFQHNCGSIVYIGQKRGGVW